MSDDEAAVAGMPPVPGGWAHARWEPPQGGEPMTFILPGEYYALALRKALNGPGMPLGIPAEEIARSWDGEPIGWTHGEGLPIHLLPPQRPR